MSLYQIRLNCALLSFRPEGHEVAFKRSASSPLGMKVVFTLSGDEGLDSAALHSPLGTPNGGDDPGKHSY